MRFLRITDLVHKVGFSRAMIYAWIKEGAFPPPIKIGTSSVWLESAVDDWMKKVVEHG